MRLRAAGDRMNFWDVFLIICVAVAVGFAVYFYVRRGKRGNGCCGNCSGCAGCGGKKPEDGKKKRD